MNSKRCTNCEVLKTKDSFYKNKNTKDGLTFHCKKCIYLYQTNILKYKTLRNSLRFRDLLNKSQFCNNCEEYKSFDRFRKHETGRYGYTGSCINCLNKRERQWKKENSHTINEYNKIYNKERRKSDVNFKLINNCRNRIWYALKDDQVPESTMKLIGCSFKELKQHLESQFTNEMNWDNYGEVWVVDHEIPCAKFDLTDPHQRAVCFHWSNLQPMLKKDNLKKSDNICIF